MKKEDEKLLNYLKLLADKSRYTIILHLMKGEECVCVLADELGLEQTLVSHHLQILREAGLIQDRKVGTWVHYSLNKKLFEEMERSYQKLLSVKNISDKSCASHDLCRKLLNNKK
jgi:ArsR family transcriptional regulator